MRTIISAVVVSLSLTLTLNAQTYENRLSTIANRPWMAEEIVDSNIQAFALVVNVASRVGDSLQDYTVLSRVNLFLSAPTADDPNFSEICQLVNLAKSDTVALHRYVVAATTATMLGYPVKFVATRPAPAAPASLLDSCLASAAKLLPGQSEKAQIAYAISTFETIVKWTSPSAENRYIAIALKQGKSIAAAKKYAAKVLAQEATRMAEGW